MALSAFEELLLNHPTSLEAAYGRARALDGLADAADHDPALVLRSIDAHEKMVLSRASEMDDKLFESIAMTCLDRMQFLGNLLGNSFICSSQLILKAPLYIHHRTLPARQCHP